MGSGRLFYAIEPAMAKALQSNVPSQLVRRHWAQRLLHIASFSRRNVCGKWHTDAQPASRQHLISAAAFQAEHVRCQAFSVAYPTSWNSTGSSPWSNTEFWQFQETT